MKQIFRFVVAVALTGAGLAQAADMTVEVAGLKHAKGQVMVAVFDRAENFLARPVQAAAVDARQGKVRLVFAGLPAGDYALSVFQDENRNGVLDMNPAGMPVEPYGFSNDAAGEYGPPSFQQARAHLPAAGGTVAIKLR